MNKKHLYYSLFVILLLIVVAAGWLTTDYFGKKARQEIIGESQASVLTISIYVSSIFDNLAGAVKSLAGSPWIVPALTSKRDRDIEHANSTLDRYNTALNGSVSYLMDANGMTVASSNRNDPDSFVGISYCFRPYFQEAAKGQADRYLALGVTSGKRGFYASYPVQNHLGKVVGVVTMKKDLEDMETFFTKYPFCFLISPGGIIFLSSKPAMVLKSLWPLDKTTQEKLIASRQLGNKPFESVMKKEIADGAEVTLEGNNYFVSRNVINDDGWSILLLTPTDHIRNSKWIGILATVSICLLILILSGIIYATDRSKEAIRQSEESKHLLLHAAGEGIFGVDTTGRVTFVNPAAMRMLGFPEEEMLGQSVHGLIHHSHEDGSNYPAEECPMYDSYTRAADNHIKDEVLWRKDGSSFPVDYYSMPIINDGKVMGAVVTFQDITERKQMEERLREKEHVLSESQRLGHIGSWFFDETRTLSWSEEMYRLYGVSPDTFTPTVECLLSLIQPDDQPRMKAWIEACAAGEKIGELEFCIKMPDGTIRSIMVHGEAVHDAGNRLKYMAGTAQDITERKQAEEKIQQMAYHDSLTGLPNRKLFSDHLGIALAQSQRNQQKIGIAMIDLDNFKGVNDTLGHDVGDLLLKATAERLSAALRKGDIVARFGGDEFALILPGLKVIEDATQVAQKIVDSFHKPFLIDTHQLAVTTSIGIAVYPDDGTDEIMLMKNADIAMYQAKQAGRARYQLYKKV